MRTEEESQLEHSLVAAAASMTDEERRGWVAPDSIPVDRQIEERNCSWSRRAVRDKVTGFISVLDFFVVSYVVQL